MGQGRAVRHDPRLRRPEGRVHRAIALGELGVCKRCPAERSDFGNIAGEESRGRACARGLCKNTGVDCTERCQVKFSRAWQVPQSPALIGAQTIQQGLHPRSTKAICQCAPGQAAQDAATRGKKPPSSAPAETSQEAAARLAGQPGSERAASAQGHLYVLPDNWLACASVRSTHYASQAQQMLSNLGGESIRVVHAQQCFGIMK